MSVPPLGSGSRPRGVSHGGFGARRPLLALARRATYAALGVFVVAMGAAIIAYPGGSWTLPEADGFSPWRNFWCDLLRSRAINGADNGAGKLLASIAFAALGAGMWPFWWVAAALLGRRRGSLIWRLGAASAVGLFAMAVLPSDRHPIAHGVVALVTGAAGIIAAGVCVVVRLPDETRFAPRRAAGALALLFATGHAVLYVYVAYLQGPETPAQPMVQKLATALLLTWMVTTVDRARSLE